jgi:ribonuclease HI
MFKFFCDGSSRVVEGERRGFIGIVGYQDGKVIAEHAAAVGLATGNEAEYYAVIGALVIAKRFTPRCVLIMSDSQLVVRQLAGEYVIKARRLAKLADVFQNLADDFDRVSVEYGTHGRAHTLAGSARAVARIDPSLQKVLRP